MPLRHSEGIAYINIARIEAVAYRAVAEGAAVYFAARIKEHIECSGAVGVVYKRIRDSSHGARVTAEIIGCKLNIRIRLICGITAFRKLLQSLSTVLGAYGLARLEQVNAQSVCRRLLFLFRLPVGRALGCRAVAVSSGYITVDGVSR